MTRQMTGAKMVVQALKDQGVDTVFGYPGGAVLPIYDEVFLQNDIRHILVRHEQGAVHAAEGYARATGKPGVALVTSGPGATNAVTGLTDALMDSIPIIVLTGQVPTFMIGSDAFQEADTVGITRPCTKHELAGEGNRQVWPETMHEAFHVATCRSPRPGPDRHSQGRAVRLGHLCAAAEGAGIWGITSRRSRAISTSITELAEAMETAKRPDFLHRRRGDQFRPRRQPASARTGRYATGFPITSTLMGLGAYPASPANTGWACWGCMVSTRPTWRCMTAI